MISSLDNLVEIFDKMQANGFNTNFPLKWGFYFVDADKEKLMKIFLELKDKDYVLEKIYLAQETDAEWTLHTSKIDILNPEKLHKRNIAFNKLAEYFQVSLYDGWDVEKVQVDNLQ